MSRRGDAHRGPERYPSFMTICLVLIGLGALGAVAWLRLRDNARFDYDPPEARPPESRSTGSLRTVFLAACDGTRLEGWLVTPSEAPPAGAPLVIMAPGLTGTKDAFYERFAWAFAERGIATLMLDFRCFGGSEGTPRHWADPHRHVEDYRSAIAWARRGEAAEIDASRIALWGSSFSGGVALVTAASDPLIRAVVAQCPYVETAPSQEPSRWEMARYVVATALDLSGFVPVYLPAFGRPGEHAFARSLENPSVRDFEGPLGAPFWRALPSPPRGGWQNKLLARILARLDEFRPMDALARLRCPTLLVAAERDDMILLEQVERAHGVIPAEHKQLLTLPAGHFDLYCGEVAEENVAAQAGFLARWLIPR